MLQLKRSQTEDPLTYRFGKCKYFLRLLRVKSYTSQQQTISVLTLPHPQKSRRKILRIQKRTHYERNFNTSAQRLTHAEPVQHNFEAITLCSWLIEALVVQPNTGNLRPRKVSHLTFSVFSQRLLTRARDKRVAYKCFSLDEGGEHRCSLKRDEYTPCLSRSVNSPTFGFKKENKKELEKWLEVADRCIN